MPRTIPPAPRQLPRPCRRLLRVRQQPEPRRRPQPAQRAAGGGDVPDDPVHQAVPAPVPCRAWSAAATDGAPAAAAAAAADWAAAGWGWAVAAAGQAGAQARRKPGERRPRGRVPWPRTSPPSRRHRSACANQSSNPKHSTPGGDHTKELWPAVPSLISLCRGCRSARFNGGASDAPEDHPVRGICPGSHGERGRGCQLQPSRPENKLLIWI